MPEAPRVIREKTNIGKYGLAAHQTLIGETQVRIVQYDDGGAGDITVLFEANINTGYESGNFKLVFEDDALREIELNAFCFSDIHIPRMTYRQLE